MRCPFRSVLISALASGLGILFAFATGPTAQAQSPQDEKTSTSPAAQPGTQSAERGAQIQPGTSRPKIGVALEGGGALGLAHIGVLQWFEDHHIPIDYKCQQVSERCGNWFPGGDGYWAAVYWRKRGRHGACKMVF
jgi:hypothetical protein